jgi:Domain of unknown function (DUF4123)
MTNEKIIQAINDTLFGSEDLNVFAVLDGASVPGLLDQLHDQQPEHVCLYRGELEPDMAEVAPYLVKLESDTDFTEWLIEKGWGNHWGVFAQSAESLSGMRRHFRKFLVVYDPDSKPLYFRYYDPRVLRIYLPTCNAQELATVFGPVACYILEHEGPETALRFRTEAGSLIQDTMTITEK